MSTSEAPQAEFTQFPPAIRIADGLSKIALVIRQQAWGKSWNRGLTPTQGQVLISLNRRPDKRMTLPDIASEMAVSKVTACITISVLTRKGLVKKERRRSVLENLYVRLTRKGQEEADRASHWSEFLVPMIQKLPLAQQTDLHRGLVRIILALQERKEIAVQQMCITCNYFRANVYDNPAAPHHCELVNAPFGDGQIRLSCPDHQPTTNLIQLERWQAAQHA